MGLVGCVAPEQVSVSTSPEDQPKLESITLDTYASPEGDLALLDRGKLLYLGVSKEEAFRVFEQPEKASPFNSLPPVLSEDKFASYGWETNTLSFGVVTYKEGESEMVALAMTIQESVNDETVAEAIQKYTEAFGAADEPDPGRPTRGTRVAYYFWTVPGRRLMINTSLDARGHRSLTVALGVPNLMTTLGMSPDSAAKDFAKAVDQLGKIESR